MKLIYFLASSLAFNNGLKMFEAKDDLGFGMLAIWIVCGLLLIYSN